MPIKQFVISKPKSSVDDEALKKNLKVTEKEAIAIELKAHTGTVQEVEYEIKRMAMPAMN